MRGPRDEWPKDQGIRETLFLLPGNLFFFQPALDHCIGGKATCARFLSSDFAEMWVPESSLHFGHGQVSWSKIGGWNYKGFACGHPACLTYFVQWLAVFLSCALNLQENLVHNVAEKLWNKINCKCLPHRQLEVVIYHCTLVRSLLLLNFIWKQLSLNRMVFEQVAEKMTEGCVWIKCTACATTNLALST